MNEQVQQAPQFQQQETPPSNYLAFAIISTIMCCQIFGLISIIYAASVNSKWLAGDKEGARQASRNAKTWAIIATISGAAIVLIVLILTVFGVIFTGITSGRINM